MKRFLSLVFVLLVLVGNAPGIARGAVRQGDAAAAKDVIRQVYAAYNAGDWDALDGLIAADVVDHNAVPGQAPGLEGVKRALMAFRAGFTGDITVDDLIVEGDRVVDRIHFDALHTGEFAGRAPTNKHVSVEAIELWRIEGGKIVEGWHIENLFGLLTQIGVLPNVGGGSSATMATPAAATMNASPAAMGDVTGVVRDYFAAGASGDAAGIAAVVAPDYMLHFFGYGEIQGPEGLTGISSRVRTLAPNAVCPVEEIVVEGDRAGVRWSCQGTIEGNLFGLPVNGKTFSVQVLSIVRVENGQVVEDWTAADVFGLLVQAGLVPAPGGATSATPSA